jgi:tetratricopeptide (TPR) repeat protein
MYKDRRLILAILSFVALASLTAQSAKISLENLSLTTYPFTDPDPVPILVSNPKIYPYFKYEGYTNEARKQDWKVVHLENDFIEVWVLPEVGGKVWGAREKSTGQEFIYRNEVLKFRNIAMRGPWTSGGIEFNFGIIGHHPSTATPVDYKLVEEADGSVSCWVGNIDLASRTQWRVRIHLPKDKAYFETQAIWYNPTPLHQSYYNWMTGAAFATEDLEFYCPGDQYLEHSGDPHPWPNEYGRHIAEYRENDFLSHKSYHVVGEYNDFFGGYFHEQGYGFGHWSPYEEMPGQKLWLWSLSRNGGIWEDLLTDTDGQYIEFQAGRLFNQYSPGGGHNPVTQAVFPPHTTDHWREIWFPVKSIGGLTDVSPSAVLHVEQKDGQLQIGINALEQASGTLKVYRADELVLEKPISLSPMVVFSETLNWPATKQAFRITVEEMDLNYTSDPQALQLDRPFLKPDLEGIPPAETNYRSGMEALEYREYAEAESLLKACLSDNPVHLEALSALAELYYRQGLYDKGLEQARRALSLDTYHPGANYLAGILYQAKRDYINAKEALGWAARSMEYRSAAYGNMAMIYLIENNWKEAIRYGRQALDYNRFNMQALQVLTVAHRLSEQKDQAQEVLQVISSIDPLSHFAYFERFLLDDSRRNKDEFVQGIQSELPYQAFLEVAMSYYQMGQKQTALSVLEPAGDHPLITIWKSYLQNDPQLLRAATQQSPERVFPFRLESLDALKWATKQNEHWKFNYYLALNLWGIGRNAEAAAIMESLGSKPDYPYFYLTRSKIYPDNDPEASLRDVQQALALEAKSRRILHALTQHYQQQQQYEAALSNSEKAYRQFPEDYSLGMDYVSALIHNQQYETAVEVLNKLEVLPFEGASESRRLYEWAHLGRALEQLQAKKFQPAMSTLEAFKEWPERLGVGKPYDPDERLADYLLAYAFGQLGNKAKAQEARERILNYTRQFPRHNSLQAVLGFQLMDRKVLLELVINQYGDLSGLPVATRWALAATLGQDEEAAKLMQQHQRFFSGLDFQFLKAAMEWVE